MREFDKICERYTANMDRAYAEYHEKVKGVEAEKARIMRKVYFVLGGLWLLISAIIIVVRQA